MAQNISELDIAQTFSNVILSNVTGQPDTLGVPTTTLPNQRTGNLALRDRGRIQDGTGSAVPLVLSTTLIECESEPTSAYGVVRRAELVGMHAAQFINSVIWS